jgi:hypothetical protein
MILFQENSDTVTFSPNGLIGDPPTHQKLFTFYLLAVLIFLLVRIIQLIRCLWALRRSQPAAQKVWEKAWALGKLRTCSLMRLAFLTFFLCVLEVSLTLTNTLSLVGTGRTAHSWWLLDGVAQNLAAFDFGIIVSAALYAFGFFFESRLERRKLAFNATHVPPPPTG